MNHLDLTLFVVRHLLALVFLLAAVGKLRDREATRTAAIDLGVPHRMAGAVPVALPAVELGVGVALLVPAAAGIAACAAVALVTAFSTLVAVQLGRGRRPSCNCFGAGAAPIGATTVVRNALLLAASAAVAVRWVTTLGDVESACRLGCPSDLTAGQVVAIAATVVVAIALAAHSWVIVQLLRQRGELLQRVEALEQRFGGPLLPSHAPAAMHGAPDDGHGPDAHGHHGHSPRRHRSHRHGLPIGSPAPRFALPDTTGGIVGIDELLGESGGRAADLPTVVLFLETRCEACVSLAAELGERADAGDLPTDRRLVAVVGGDPSAVAERIDRRGFAHVLVDAGGSIAQRYGVAGSPTAVLVLPDGRVASFFAEGRAAVSRLARGPATTNAETLSNVQANPNVPVTEQLLEASR